MLKKQVEMVENNTSLAFLGKCQQNAGTKRCVDSNSPSNYNSYYIIF